MNEFEDMIIVSPHLAVNVPFIENNDQARLQMSASQCRQAVPILHSEIPMVQTGFESIDEIFKPDIFKAKKDGEISFASTKSIVIKYDDGEYEIDRLFYDYTINVSTGDKVKSGDILSYKTGYFIDNTLAQGSNLLVAILSHPDTYEDAIILSNRLAKSGKIDSYNYHILEKYLTPDEILIPISDDSYNKLVPDIGEIVTRNSPMLRIKKYNKNINKLIKPSKDINASRDSEILDVEVIPYKYNTLVREFAVKMKEYQYNYKQLESYLESKNLPNNIMYRLKSIHRLYDYQKPITDNRKPIGVFIRIVYRTVERPEAGDKFSNRYANKGVVSRLLPDDEMPKLSDGRIADVIINPMSIISRMNIGQLYELASSNCMYKLRQMIESSDNLDTIKDIILQFYKIVDNTKDKWITTQLEETLNSISDLDKLKEIKNEFVFIAPPFESTKKENLIEAMKFLDVPDTQKVMYRGKEVDCNIGYMYFYRLMHIASHKLSGRSIGRFNPKTYQPVGGRKKGGGQRFGEMETWSLISYGAIENLREIITVKSDDMIAKLNWVYKVLYDIKNNTYQDKIESFKLLNSYLAVLGLKIEI